jgi:DNA repair exonuclease SbcCD ATPase subunit
MQLPAAQRRGIIEDLLDLQVFTTMNTLLKERVQENYEALQSNINDQNIVNTKIKMAREHLKELQSKSAQFIREKKTALKDIEEKIKQANSEKDSLNEELKSKNQSNSDINTLQKKIDKLKSLRIQMEAKTSLMDKEIKFFTDHENCPTCKQQISNEFSCDIVSKRETEIKEIEDGLVKLAEVYEQTNKELIELLNIDRECDEIKTKISHEKLKIKMFQDQIDSIKSEIDDAKKEIDNKSEDKIVDLEKELLELSVTYNDLSEDKQVLSAASLLLKDGGIKTKIVNQYIPIINKLINKYLGEFDLFVEFNLDEQFNEVIKSRYRDEFSYSSFSEGEKQKIDLAILFTWRAVAKLRNSLSTNLLILDEVFDSSLDGNAADDLLKILQSISTESNVFVISHRENLHDKFENVIKFVKSKNFSRIE